MATETVTVCDRCECIMRDTEPRSTSLVDLTVSTVLVDKLDAGDNVLSDQVKALPEGTRRQDTYAYRSLTDLCGGCQMAVLKGIRQLLNIRSKDPETIEPKRSMHRRLEQ